MNCKIIFIFISICLMNISELSAQRSNPGYQNRRYGDHRCERDGRGQGRGYGKGANHQCIYENSIDSTDIQKVDEVEFGDFESFDGNENNPDQISPQPDIQDDTTVYLMNGVEQEEDTVVTGNVDNVFGAFEAFDQSDNTVSGDPKHDSNGDNLKWIIMALGLTLLTGLFMKYKNTRYLRGGILLASVILFGFILGGCPCPLSSMQNTILAGIGVNRSWTGMLWFLGLIPLTYLFGRVWCGWVCHLGGLQELIYRPGKLKLLRTEKSRLIFKWTRITLLVALIVQLFITKTNLYKEIDPFKGAFNLIPANTTMWILLVMLLVSSIFIYRPFCRSVCPIGLVLGWVNKIPGASVLGPSSKCSSCKLCFGACDFGAITRDRDRSILDNAECIQCGDCIDTCKKNGFSFFRKSKQHLSTIELAGKKSIDKHDNCNHLWPGEKVNCEEIVSR